MIEAILIAVATVALGAASFLLALQAISDVISLFFLAQRKRQADDSSSSLVKPSRLLFLVPAHNEEMLVAATVHSLLADGASGISAKVVVIADNCNDATALRATEAGAEVLTRVDPERKGKPFAIAWGLSKVGVENFDAVCVVDADCLVNSGFGTEILKVARARDVLVQPYIGVRNPADSAITRLAHLYELANNRLAFGLKAAAKLNVPVGAGLCLGADLLSRRGWHAYSICEDWEIYAQLTAVNERTLYAPLARLYAQETRELEQSRTQRARWQAGKTEVLRRYIGPILTGPASKHQKLDAAAELLSLGPVTNTALSILVAVCAFSLPNSWGPVIALIAITSLVRLAVYIGIALASVDDVLPYVRALVYLPVYAVWRLMSAIVTAINPPRGRWDRAARHEAGENPKAQATVKP